MRKFMSIVTVLTLVLALAIPAFAADGSPAADLPKIDESKTEGLQSDEKLVLDAVDESEAKTAATEALKEAPAAAKGAVVSDVFDLHIEKDGKEVESYDGTVTVVLKDLSGDVVAIMYNHDGVWKSADFTKNADGTYTVKFLGLCTVVVLTKAAPATNPSGSGSSSGSGTTSPQTGFDASVYMTVAMVLVLFAGFCFVKARKVTE